MVSTFLCDIFASISLWSGRGVEPLLERRTGEGGVRSGEQPTVHEELAVRVVRVAHALDPRRVTAPGREQPRYVDELFLARTRDLRDRRAGGCRCGRPRGVGGEVGEYLRDRPGG